MIRLRLYKARERQRVIDPAALEAAYFAVDPETKPVFEHDGVMVWVSDPDHCRVERRIRGRDLHLVESGTNALPRARGLEILRTPGADYRWVHSLDWRWAAGEYLDRDRVEAIVNRALDIQPWAAPEGPVGLVHLSYLMCSTEARWPTAPPGRSTTAPPSRSLRAPQPPPTSSSTRSPRRLSCAGIG